MARLTVPVQVRWSDIDGYGHVNNAAVLTLLEEARVAAFWRSAPGSDGAGHALLDGGPEAATATFIAHQEIEYLAPLSYPDEPLQVQLWLGRLGGASLEVCYEIAGTDGIAVRASTTLVLVERATGRPRRLTDDERASWSELLEAPVEFRRRRSR